MLRDKAGDPGRTGADNRLFMEAVLWIARAGAGARKKTVRKPSADRARD